MASEGPVVNVKQGQLRGVNEKNVYDEQYLAFRGIPFAKPPTGSLKFKEPQPLEPWTGIREAKDYGNSCAQFDIFTQQFIGSDDCLYLNVYTPSIEATSRRAVMVWIHGGGFVHGTGNNQIYGPDYLIRKDVVLVTINYRLTVLGFLDAGHEVASGNQGLKDQVMALKWVQENISNFGGDPENVTIFGESAGGASVHYLTISPLAQGLFHKAIAQSGVALNPWAMISGDRTKYVFELASNLGKDTTDPEEAVQFLQTVETSDLLAASVKLVPNEDSHMIFGRFLPSVDTESPNPFMPQPPALQMRSGVKVPLLLGWNTSEGSIFVSPSFTPASDGKETEKIFERSNSNFETLIHPELIDALKKEGVSPQDVKRLYFGDRAINKDTVQQYVDLMGDMMFLRGIFEVVRTQMETNTPVTYLYKFTYDDEQSVTKAFMKIDLPGTAHADELAYIFYPEILKKVNVEPFEVGTLKYKISEYFTQMWTDFAKMGNPTPMTTDLISTIWKPVEKGDVFNYLNIGDTLKMETTRKDEHTFDWKKMKNKL